MKKILIGVFSFLFAFVGVVNAGGSVVYPSTFKLEVGEDVYVSNYQNMRLELKSVTGNVGDCNSTGTPCPLGNPVSTTNPRKTVVVQASTEGGCGPGSDPRCLGAPAFSMVLNINEGSTAYARALGVKVVSISENSATLALSYKESGVDTGGETVMPIPTEIPKEVNIIPIGRIPGNGGGGAVDGSSVIPGNSGTIEGKSIVYPLDTITICPMGKEDCTVCSKGSCKEKTVPYTEGTSNAPGVRKMMLPENTEITSVDADKNSSSSPAYKVKAIRKARLFYLFPVNAEVSYTVDAKTGSSTVSSKPWWNFLAW